MDSSNIPPSVSPPMSIDDTDLIQDDAELPSTMVLESDDGKRDDCKIDDRKVDQYTIGDCYS